MVIEDTYLKTEFKNEVLIIIVVKLGHSSVGRFYTGSYPINFKALLNSYDLSKIQNALAFAPHFLINLFINKYVFDRICELIPSCRMYAENV